MAQGARNTARRAFGDVSNTKDMARISRDDSTVAGKPAAPQVQKAAVLSQPAQRPMSMSGLKGVLNTVSEKPTNPAGKVQPAVKQAKRNNVVFRDQLESAYDTGSSEETAIEQKAFQNCTYDKRDPIQTIEEEEGNKVEKAENAVKIHKATEVEEVEVNELKDHRERRASTYSGTSISDVEESKEETKDDLKKPILTPPEDETKEWEDAEEENLAGPPFLSRTDNTTGGTTTVLFPKITERTRREMLRAKDMVDSSRSEEDILEDYYDSSMVAEYSSEIFLHLRNKEVCDHHSLHFNQLVTNTLFRFTCYPSPTI